jgi:hypothetical protein
MPDMPLWQSSRVSAVPFWKIPVVVTKHCAAKPVYPLSIPYDGFLDRRTTAISLSSPLREYTNAKDYSVFRRKLIALHHLLY